MKRGGTYQKILRLVAKPIAAFVVLMLIAGPFQPLTAYAQGLTDGPTTNAQQQAESDKNLGKIGPQPKDEIGCFTGAGGVGNTIAVCLTNIIYVVTVGIGSGFAYVASIFFNFAVALSLNSFSYALQFISGGWTVARDIANMFFILILVYIAFAIMLSADTAGMMRVLATVIFIALIVNFSFFFTRIVIDTGNILAVQFYNAIPAPSISQTINSATSASGQTGSSIASSVSWATGYSGANTKDLTAVIMNALQIQNLFNNKSFEAFTQSQNSGFLTTFLSLTFIYIAAAIFLWLLTVAFITNGIKFLMRIVVLWMVIIASPLAFLAYALPQTHKYFEKWREALVSHTIYPVVFLFIFLVLVNVMGQISNCPATTAASGAAGITQSGCLMGDLFGSISAVNGDAGFIAIIGVAVANTAIRLGFVIALLFIAMKAADQIGVIGAEQAGKIGSKVGGWYSGAMRWAGRQPVRAVAGVGKGLGGLAYRETVGRGSYKLASSLKDRGSVGYGLAKRIGGVAESSIGGVKSFADAEKYRAERGRYFTNQEDLQWMVSNKSNYQAAKKKAVAARSAGEQTLVDEGDRVKNRMKGLREPDFETLKFKEIKSLTDVISADQLKVLQGSKKLSETEKEELTNDWNTYNSAAAFQKANREVGDIRKLASELHGLGITLARVDHHIGGASTAPRPGSLIDKDIIIDMKKEAKRQLATLDSTIAATARTGANTTDLRENRDKMKEAIDHMEKLETARGDVQANVGGEKEEGKFKTLS